MERVIWKFRLRVEPDQEIELPHGAEILSLQTQQNEPVLWALVDPKAPYERRRFLMVGTGEPVHAGTTYVGSVQTGPFVWHYFLAPSRYSPS